MYLNRILLVALFCFSNNGFSLPKDLGGIGDSYPIKERDLIEVMKAKAQAKLDAGEGETLRKELTSRGQQYVKTPPGTSLPTAQAYTAHKIVPTYVVPDDITDAEGKVLYKAGTTVHSLEVMSLTKSLCFVNGDDPRQLDWLEQYCTDNINNKLILVDGNFQNATEKLGRRLYFDQHGQLVNRLGITAVPAIVRQNGDALYVEQFPLN